MVGGGGGDVVGGLVVGGLVGGGLVVAGPPAGADVGRVVDEDGLEVGRVVDEDEEEEGTVTIGAEAAVVRSRLPLAWTVNQLFWKPCPFACDSEWSPALK